LQDILDAIQVIEQYLPVDRADFDRDPPLQSHIYRHLMIIGEAAWKLSDLLKRQHPNIPWRKIEGMRHVMVHDYFKVNWKRVYETARDDIPTLKPLIENILASLPPESTP
jgi:uncharacterized protein with HEPN domain